MSVPITIAATSTAPTTTIATIEIDPRSASAPVRAVVEELDQRAHADARGARRAEVVAVAAAPRRAGDVHVRPLRLLHEVREERGARDRAAAVLAGVDVLQVGD